MSTGLTELSNSIESDNSEGLDLVNAVGGRSTAASDQLVGGDGGREDGSGKEASNGEDGEEELGEVHG